VTKGERRMKENTKKFLKKNGITVWLVTVAILLFLVGSYAAYINLGYVKGVIATQGSSGLAFSSNYLGEYNRDDTNYSIKWVAFGGDNPYFTVSVCNYPQGNSGEINEKDITYDFQATLVDAGGNAITDISNIEKYTMSCSNIEGDPVHFTLSNGVYTCKMTSTLTGGTIQGQRDIFTINMGEILNKEIYVKVEAIPNDASKSATDNRKLARILGFTEADDGSTSSGWNGSFTDRKGQDTADLSAFNYELTGSGSGTITLKWDTRYVEISPLFLKKYGLTASEVSGTNLKQVKISVNSSEQSDYRFQFFRTSIPESGEQWSGSEIVCNGDHYVTCEFDEQ
jgi:hypothetical protein